jgi:ABC-type nitrate/sulfonate/bicarbonate transport system ATPase subunit
MNAYTKNEPILDIANVSLSYGDKQILRGINATVHNIVRPGLTQGQVIGFLGPSGIGKTQLSRIIAGLQKPTSGVVTVKGQPVKAGMVGMVPQNYALFDWATVVTNLQIAARQAKLTPTQTTEKIQFYVDTFGLGDYLLSYPAQLSGGTRQRVSIVQQLLCSEHFIVMDEPFSGLDIVMKRRACELISQVASLDDLNTVIVVTHDVTEACSIADTIWLMGLEKSEDGKFISGSKLVEQYDLAAMGLCWSPEITKSKEFNDFVLQIKERFATLKTF